MLIVQTLSGIIVAWKLVAWSLSVRSMQVVHWTWWWPSSIVWIVWNEGRGGIERRERNYSWASPTNIKVFTGYCIVIYIYIYVSLAETDYLTTLVRIYWLLIFLLIINCTWARYAFKIIANYCIVRCTLNMCFKIEIERIIYMLKMFQQYHVISVGIKMT